MGSNFGNVAITMFLDISNVEKVMLIIHEQLVYSKESLKTVQD